MLKLRHPSNEYLKRSENFKPGGVVWKKIGLTSIRLYQLVVSPIMGPVCRFSPSCSQYAYQAIERYGIAKGFLLSIKRVSRCHPFHPGGYDPVP
jgi:putative membrane protein insertion efficiency factor